MTETSGEASQRSLRRFGLVDAMTFIAATSAGFASYRICTDRWAGLGPIPFPRQPDLWAIGLLYRVATWTPLWLAPWTAALLILSLRQPRARPRRLARRPGFVASVAASSTLAAGVVAIISVLVVRCLPTWRIAYWGAFAWPLFFHCAFDLQLPTLMGVSVAGGWLVMFLSGRWSPGRCWIDRLGRTLGYCWIALLLINAFLMPWLYLSNNFRVPPPALRAVAR